MGGGVASSSSKSLTESNSGECDGEDNDADKMAKRTALGDRNPTVTLATATGGGEAGSETPTTSSGRVGNEG